MRTLDMEHSGRSGRTESCGSLATILRNRVYEFQSREIAAISRPALKAKLRSQSSGHGVVVQLNMIIP